MPASSVPVDRSPAQAPQADIHEAPEGLVYENNECRVDEEFCFEVVNGKRDAEKKKLTDRGVFQNLSLFCNKETLKAKICKPDPSLNLTPDPRTAGGREDRQRNLQSCSSEQVASGVDASQEDPGFLVTSWPEEANPEFKRGITLARMASKDEGAREVGKEDFKQIAQEDPQIVQMALEVAEKQPTQEGAQNLQQSLVSAASECEEVRQVLQVLATDSDAPREVRESALRIIGEVEQVAVLENQGNTDGRSCEEGVQGRSREGSSQTSHDEDPASGIPFEICETPRALEANASGRSGPLALAPDGIPLGHMAASDMSSISSGIPEAGSRDRTTGEQGVGTRNRNYERSVTQGQRADGRDREGVGSDGTSAGSFGSSTPTSEADPPNRQRPCTPPVLATASAQSSLHPGRPDTEVRDGGRESGVRDRWDRVSDGEIPESPRGHVRRSHLANNLLPEGAGAGAPRPMAVTSLREEFRRGEEGISPSLRPNWVRVLRITPAAEAQPPPATMTITVNGEEMTRIIPGRPAKIFRGDDLHQWDPVIEGREDLRMIVAFDALGAIDELAFMQALFAASPQTHNELTEGMEWVTHQVEQSQNAQAIASSGTSEGYTLEVRYPIVVRDADDKQVPAFEIRARHATSVSQRGDVIANAPGVNLPVTDALVEEKTGRGVRLPDEPGGVVMGPIETKEEEPILGLVVFVPIGDPRLLGVIQRQGLSESNPRVFSAFRATDRAVEGSSANAGSSEHESRESKYGSSNGGSPESDEGEQGGNGDGEYRDEEELASDPS